MTTRTISIGDDAYRRLKRLKKADESFTDVILRLTGQGDLTRFSGSISAEFARELSTAAADVRARFDREHRARGR